MRVVLKEFDETSVIVNFVRKCVYRITGLLIIIVIVVNLFPNQVAFGLKYAYKVVPAFIIGGFKQLHDALAQGNTINSASPPNNQLSEDLNQALQMVLIQVSEWNANLASLQRYRRGTITEPWKQFGDVMRVVTDNDGLAWADQKVHTSLIKEGDPIKRSGDNRSPAGVFRFGTAFGTYLQQSDLNIDYLPITGRELCVYDYNSRYFNELVSQTRVDASESDKALKIDNGDGKYNLGILLEYPRNAQNPVSLSCIFLYSGTGRGLFTAGSIEVRSNDLEKIVYWLKKESKPVLVILMSRDVKPLLNLEPLPNPPSALAEVAESWQ